MFLILFVLEQPAADIAMVIPIAISIFTPIPLIVYGIVYKVWKWLVYLGYKFVIKDNKIINFTGERRKILRIWIMILQM